MLKEKLEKYVNKFNGDDNEYYKQDIDNAHAYEWLLQNAPRLECPESTLEEIFYFRWWTLRKHIKTTEDGYVVTEFLPPVCWGGKHNTIVAAVGHHISEVRWLKNSRKILEDYIKLWLEEKSYTYKYSSWLAYSIYEYCVHINDFTFGTENLDLIINYYETTVKEHKTDSGLFWSIDNNDAMEYSISGTGKIHNRQKGIRPTMNSYMSINAYAISKLAEKAGRTDVSEKYYNKYIEIKEKMFETLWDGEFFKSIHADDVNNIPSVKDIAPERNAKELIGYIPWCFNLVPEGCEKAFAELLDESGFKCKYGLTTAEQRHPDFLFEANHECLWNGYVWPFATSQTLDAVISVLENYKQDVITQEDFYDMLLTYAKSHYRILPDGKKVCWIDEVKHPETDDWSSRTILENWGWTEEKGGFERGKDYNHSTFCDIVIKGLLGIKSENGKVTVNPKIPENWNYFMLENLWIGGKEFKIVYDKTGEHYNNGKGLNIYEL